MLEPGLQTGSRARTTRAAGSRPAGTGGLPGSRNRCRAGRGRSKRRASRRITGRPWRTWARSASGRGPRARSAPGAAAPGWPPRRPPSRDRLQEIRQDPEDPGEAGGEDRPQVLRPSLLSLPASGQGPPHRIPGKPARPPLGRRPPGRGRPPLPPPPGTDEPGRPDGPGSRAPPVRPGPPDGAAPAPPATRPVGLPVPADGWPPRVPALPVRVRTPRGRGADGEAIGLRLALPLRLLNRLQLTTEGLAPGALRLMARFPLLTLRLQRLGAAQQRLPGLLQRVLPGLQGRLTLLQCLPALPAGPLPLPDGPERLLEGLLAPAQVGEGLLKLPPGGLFLLQGGPPTPDLLAKPRRLRLGGRLLFLVTEPGGLGLGDGRLRLLQAPTQRGHPARGPSAPERLQTGERLLITGAPAPPDGEGCSAAASSPRADPGPGSGSAGWPPGAEGPPPRFIR
jgi:hypothetical protein